MPQDEISNAVLAERLAGLQASIMGLQVTLTNMTSQLGQVPLISRDVQHLNDTLAIQKSQLNALHERVDIVEVEMPGLLELRKWVIAGILAALSMMGLSLFKLAVYNPYVGQQDLSALISTVTKIQQEHDRESHEPKKAAP